MLLQFLLNKLEDVDWSSVSFNAFINKKKQPKPEAVETNTN